MKKTRTTGLLVVLDAALTMVVAACLIHFNAARSNAQRDQQDASVVLTDLDQIASARQPVEAGQPNRQITAGLQVAAAEAGVTQQLQSVEAGAARDADDPPTLAVRLSAVTLDQLQVFLEKLQHSSQPLLSTNVHLSVPQGPDAIAAPAGEAWTAEIELRAALGNGSR